MTASTAFTAPTMNKRQEPSPEIELEYAKLARHVGRLFYARKNQGLHCVLLNLLTKHEWIKEDMLAKQLGLSWRQVRKVLRELQQDFLVTRIVMKDSKASSSTQSFKGENTHSYCCLDYKRMVDSCRLKMYRLRKYFKGELEDKAKIEDYVCSDSDCQRTYTSLEALDLEVDPTTFVFMCEYCGSSLEQGGDKCKGKDKDEAEERKMQETLRKQQALFEQELNPFAELLKRIQPYNPPYFGTLQEWATAQAKIRQAAIDGEPLEENQANFVIEFEDEEGEGDVKEKQKVEAKELPPWMRLGYQDVVASAPPVKAQPLGREQELDSMSNQDTATQDGTYTSANAKRQLEDNSAHQQGKRIKLDSTSDFHAPAETQGQPQPENEKTDDADDDIEWEDI